MSDEFSLLWLSPLLSESLMLVSYAFMLPSTLASRDSTEAPATQDSGRWSKEGNEKLCGSGLNETSNNCSINDLLEHNCPFFFQLERIYGTRPNIKKVTGSDSGDMQDSRNVVEDAFSTIAEGNLQSPGGLFDNTKDALLQDTQSTSHSIENVDDEGPTKRNWKSKT
ncbi:hypothetical protein RUND412_008816 [Rhizina undulata]